MNLTDLFVTFFSHPLVLMALGLLSYTIQDFIAFQKDERKHKYNSFKAYLLDNRYSIIVTTIGAVVGFVILYQMGELTSLNAFGLGYIANSVGAMAAKSVSSKVGK
jgi:hypothetical protein